MGIRFTSHSKSWRAPLQLIDSWLPIRSSRPVQPVNASRAVQAFARAGWLKDATLVQPAGPASGALCPAVQRTPLVRLLRTPANESPTDTRLVISGRIGEVCAELERLAKLERTGSARSA